MASKLYQSAATSLSEPERGALSRFEAWLEAYFADPSRGSSDGGRILENIRSESHLVGDDGYGDGKSMAAFLQQCASSHGPGSGDDSHTAYETTCLHFQLKGLRIQRGHLPAQLLRYTLSWHLVFLLVGRLLGMSMQDAFRKGELSVEDAFAQLEIEWNPGLLRDEDRLGGGLVVFATFEHAAGVPRQDATAMSKALALPVWQGARTGKEFLVEVAYSSSEVEDPRFPTVADAGWIHLFRPAEECEPSGDDLKTCCGWTDPLDGQAAQPELVHENRPLRILGRSPRFVGRVPL